MLPTPTTKKTLEMAHTTKSEDSAREPFLSTSQHEDWEEESVVKPKLFLQRVNYGVVVTHLLIALTYLVVITSTAFTGHAEKLSGSVLKDAADIYCEYRLIRTKKTLPLTLLVPAEEPIEYELVDFPLRDFYHNNPFVGNPRPAHNEAWGDLLKSMLKTPSPQAHYKSLIIPHQT
jgi:hypothetical protein